MTMPEFREPAFPTGEDLGAAMAAVVTAIEAQHPTTPEEAAAAALAAAEQLGQAPPADRHDYAPAPDDEHDQAAPAVPPMPEQAPAQPLFAGTYAIYDDGASGVVLVIGQSTGEVVRKQIPAGMIKMAERFGGGGGLAGLFGGA